MGDREGPRLDSRHHQVTDSGLVLDKQYTLGNRLYYVYEPVWAGHKAKLYAAHVQFDIYMPLWGPFFTFLPLASVTFLKSAPKVTSR